MHEAEVRGLSHLSLLVLREPATLSAISRNISAIFWTDVKARPTTRCSTDCQSHEPALSIVLSAGFAFLDLMSLLQIHHRPIDVAGRLTIEEPGDA
jgi:hypothetical protein